MYSPSHRPARDSSNLPRFIGRYRVLGLLGSGGMADIHLAAATGPLGFAKLVVLKVLRAHGTETADAAAMFLDEARLAARLSHPNLVHTFEFGVEEGELFLAMEHLEGQPLRRIVRRLDAFAAWREAFAVHVLLGVLDGLHHAHELRDASGEALSVVHRDVSPENVFITYDGAVKVVDFGIAKANDAASSTKIGTVKGKIAYMAPEQARGDAIDRRADVFACGAVFFELLTGRRIWDGLADAVVATRLVSNEVPSVFVLEPSLPVHLLHILDRALAAEPAHRYPSAEAMRIDLEILVETRNLRLAARDIASVMTTTFAGERERFDSRVRGGLTSLTSERLGSLKSAVGPIAFGEATAETDAMLTILSPTAAKIAKKTKPKRGSRIGRIVALVAASTGIAAGAAFAAKRSYEGASSNATAVVPVDVEAATEALPAGDACSLGAKPVVVLEGDIEANALLECDRDYVLKHDVFVRSGATLTIGAGTRIRGDHETMGTLVIEPGGRIVARGTEEKPIVFTSTKEPGEEAPGDWGGLVVLGRAPTNLRDATGRPTRGEVEGLVARGTFGGDEPDDSSGVISYVRIEYAGRELAPNNEINGLTLAGVGRGTKLDHVQVRYPLDDCFEFFGGTVDGDHLVCDAPGDDGFDWDLGYTGRLQFLLFRDDVAVFGSNAFEGDNDARRGISIPRSAPEIWNATACAGADTIQSDGYAVLFRAGTKGRIGAGLFLGYPVGVDVRDGRAEADLVASEFLGTTLPVVAHDEGAANTHRDDDGAFDEVAWLAAAARYVTARVDPSVRFTAVPGSYKPERAIPTNGLTPPNDGFFDPRASYVGAFRDRTDRWDEEAWVRPMAP